MLFIHLIKFSNSCVKHLMFGINILGKRKLKDSVGTKEGKTEHPFICFFFGLEGDQENASFQGRSDCWSV